MRVLNSASISRLFTEKRIYQLGTRAYRKSLLWAGMFSTLTECVERVSVLPLVFELNSAPAIYRKR